MKGFEAIKGFVVDLCISVGVIACTAVVVAILSQFLDAPPWLMIAICLITVSGIIAILTNYRR